MPNDPADAIQAIATRLRESRQRAKISQRDCAERVGVSYGALRSWEKGETAQPAWALAQIAMLLGVSLDYLTSGRRAFCALVDKAAETEALGASDSESFGRITQRVSVFVTEHVELVTTMETWAARMARIEKHGAKLRGDGDESGSL